MASKTGDNGIKRRLYGRRMGHKLRPHQMRLMAERLPELTINLQADGLQSWFDKPFAAYALEIGFGGGEHLRARAKAAADTGFIGCEPFINGIAKLVLAIEDEGLTNIRIYNDDARHVLDVLPPQSLHCVFLLYPDPWPKRRHHKRRFVQQDNLEAVFNALVEGGRFVVASDMADYLDWTLAAIYTHGGFAWPVKKAEDWRLPPHDWPGTRYETKALRSGRRPGYLHFTRRLQRKPQSL